MEIGACFVDLSELELHLEQTQNLLLVLCETDICKECLTMKHIRGSFCVVEQRIQYALDELGRLDGLLKIKDRCQSSHG